jgi:hypothetical protein
MKTTSLKITYSLFKLRSDLTNTKTLAAAAAILIMLPHSQVKAALHLQVFIAQRCVMDLDFAKNMFRTN